MAVLLLNYYGSSDTIECVRSLQKSMLPNGWGVKILIGNITENGREDSAREEKEHLLRALHDIHVIDLPNLGFAGGNNTLLRAAQQLSKPDVYVLLNNDTITHTQSLNILCKKALESNALLSPKIYFAAGKEFHTDAYAPQERGRVLWYAGGVIDRKNMYAWNRSVDEVDFGQQDRLEMTDFATGCCLVFSDSVLKDLGMMDESYFMYMEDVDYCLRAKERGIDVLYVPEAVIWHKNAGSSAGSGSEFHVYYQTRNRMAAGIRWGNWRLRRALRREAERLLQEGSSVEKHAIMDWKHGQLGKRKGGENGVK